MATPIGRRFLAGTFLCLVAHGCDFSHPEDGANKTEWLEDNGVVDVFKNDALTARFLDVYKLVGDARYGSCEGVCAYGFGVLDVNQNYRPDHGEQERFFAVGDYGNRYVYYANPLGSGVSRTIAGGA